MKDSKSVKRTLPPDEYPDFSYGQNDNAILSSLPNEKKVRLNPIGARIRYARERLGYTQATLGEKCGMTTDTIKNVELGRSAINTDYLKALSKTLGLSFEAIIYGICAESVKDGVVLNLGLEQHTINCLCEYKKTKPELLKIINRLFLESETAKLLFEAIEIYLRADLLPLIKDSEGCMQENTSQEKIMRNESMEAIEEVLKSYRYKKPRYDEEESARLEREAKRILDRMIENRKKLKDKTEKEAQELIAECEEMTPDDVL